MADGEINRNGATIRIDDNGGVQVEPADGQEVEYTGADRGTDAIRESVETEDLSKNRSWTDVTSSRSLATQETNDSGGDLEVIVNVQADNDATTVGLNMTVGGDFLPGYRLQVDDGERVSVGFSVPKGETYEINTFGDTSDFSLNLWVER